MSVSMNIGTTASTTPQANLSQTTSTTTFGRFISFEGTEGVGKTTAIEQLCTRLDDNGIEYVRTREPGGSPFAERLRDILLDPTTDITDDTELLLLFAARCDHLQQVILPALTRGSWVICDRFTDSTIAYQGFGRGHGDRAVRHKIEVLMAQFVPRQPDLTLWLDLPIEEGIRRAGKRGAADRFEQETLSFFDRVRAGFSAQAEQYPERIAQIDALGSADEVGARIWQTVTERFMTK